jgi:hypothetical protein
MNLRNWRSKTSDRKELKSTSRRAARDGEGVMSRRGHEKGPPGASSSGSTGLKIHWISNTTQPRVFLTLPGSPLL